MTTINAILAYIGLYGFTIDDGLFFLGTLLLIVVLIKLYTMKRT